MNDSALKYAFLMLMAAMTAATHARAATDLLHETDHALHNADHAFYEANRALYDSIAGAGDDNPIEIRLRIQSRYQYNERDEMSGTIMDPDQATTVGFVNRRVNVDFRGRLTDRLRARVRFAVGRGTGQTAAEYAHGIYDIADGVSITAGLIRAKVVREEYISASTQLTSERSPGNETFNQGFTEGIELAITRDAWRAFFSITDGFGASSTPINAPGEADFAASARFERRFGGASWGSYKQFTSFRGGEPGVMLGGAVSVQRFGDTNPGAAADMTQTTLIADASILGGGWNAYFSALVNHADMDGADLTDTVLLAQGGFFVTDRDEFFARWNGIFPDKDNAPMDEDFHAVAAGWNHYFVEGSHAAKLTVDAFVALDPTTTSIVRTSTGHNLLPDTESGQVGVTVQMQILF